MEEQRDPQIVTETSAHQCIQVANIATLIANMNAFKRWQEQQNGTLRDVEKKLDRLVKLTNENSLQLGRICAAEEAVDKSEKVGFLNSRNRHDRIAIYVSVAMVVITIINVFFGG